MNVEIVHYSANKLTKEEWLFQVTVGYGSHSALTVRLERWSRSTRLTTRHKTWHLATEGYMRRSHNGHHFSGYRLSAENVPFPDSVKYEVEKAIIDRFVFEGAVDPKEERAI